MKEGIQLKSRAAVAFKPGEPLQIVEIDVEEPKAKEVLVKILYTSVCHTERTAGRLDRRGRCWCCRCCRE